MASQPREIHGLYLHSDGKANSAGGDGLFPPSSRKPSPPTATFMIRRIRFPQTADRSVAIPIIRPDLATSKRWNAARMCWYIRLLRLPPIQKSRVRWSVDLYATSSAVDTDFTAKLVDVDEKGIALNLTEGIVRARYRDSQLKPSKLIPGHIYKFTIDLWATSNVFRAGHKLRLEVSSSNFPASTAISIWASQAARRRRGPRPRIPSFTMLATYRAVSFSFGEMSRPDRPLLTRFLYLFTLGL